MLISVSSLLLINQVGFLVEGAPGGWWQGEFLAEVLVKPVPGIPREPHVLCLYFSDASVKVSSVPKSALFWGWAGGMSLLHFASVSPSISSYPVIIGPILPTLLSLDTRFQAGETVLTEADSGPYVSQHQSKSQRQVLSESTRNGFACFGEQREPKKKPCPVPLSGELEVRSFTVVQEAWSACWAFFNLADGRKSWWHHHPGPSWSGLLNEQHTIVLLSPSEVAKKKKAQRYCLAQPT